MRVSNLSPGSSSGKDVPLQQAATSFPLASALATLKGELLAHPLFAAVRTLDHLRLFMQSHVYAVWDFMSLVKRLQNHFAPTTVPWLPPRDPLAARLINEITLGEESDHDHQGQFASHFQLYLGAMREIGADSTSVEAFVTALSQGPLPVPDAHLRSILDLSRAPQGVADFVSQTLDLAQHGSIEAVMGSFFYGREDVVPLLFEKLLAQWSISRASVPTFAYYLDRHIQLDRDEHGPLAQALIDRWVGHDSARRERLLQAACASLQARIRLWDRVLMRLQAETF